VNQIKRPIDKYCEDTSKSQEDCMKASVLTAAALIAVALVAPVRAGDIQGDAYDCHELWVMRNQIYKDNGYCFKTARAISYFGNGGCGYSNEASLPLSRQDRHVIGDIKRSEVRQGC
jgi:hypothetical protein